MTATARPVYSNGNDVPPPIGSVVVDARGITWDHLVIDYSTRPGKPPDWASVSGWYPDTDFYGDLWRPCSFYRLVTFFGPVTLVHVGNGDT